MPALTAPSQPQSLELRVWERFPCILVTSCQPLAARGDGDVSWSARVHDISAGGLSLVLARRFERGTGLAIEIPETADRPADTLLVKVVHATRLPDNQWLLGCAFVSQLSDEEVQTLSRLGTQPHHVDKVFSQEQAKTTQVIADVTLVGAVPGQGQIARRARRFFLTGCWPLAGGTLLKIGRHRDQSSHARLKVHRCFQQGSRWIVHYTLLDTPAPELLRWLGMRK